ncbi:MAG: phage tail tube protein [Thermodesulfobacteriota bacterium]
MPKATGANSRIVVDTETTFKADPGTPNGRVIPFLSCTLKAEQPLLSDESLTGSRNKSAPELGQMSVAGDLVVNLCATAHSLLFRHLLGGVTTTGASDPYTHTLKVGTLPVGMVFNKEFTDINQYHKYNGCRVSGMSMEVKPDGFIATTFRFLGSKETVGGTAYDATPTSEAYDKFTGFHGTILEGGAAIATVTNFKFDIDNDLDPDVYVIGSAGEREELPEGSVLVKGSIEAFFEDDTLLAKARASTESSLKITLDKGVTPARSVELFIPELRFKRTGPDISGPKGIKTTLDFEGYYDNSTEASSIQVIIKNGLTAL